MDSQTLETCAEHKLPVADEDDRRLERMQRAQWLRAAILGVNDGLLSTTSLMLGVGAAKEDRWSMVLAGLAGALAGSCSMAVGEFVSVSTQRDIEKATINDCSSTTKLADGGGIKLHITASESPITIVETELGETKLAVSSALTPSRRNLHGKLICVPSEKASPAITPGRKLPPVLSPGRSPMMKVITEDARTKTVEVMEDNGEEALPNPYKAAAASSLAFLCGSLVPLVSAMFVAKNTMRIVVIPVVTSIALVLSGGMGAHLGGSPVKLSAVRVLVGGWIAMAITYGLLKPFDRDHGRNDKN